MTTIELTRRIVLRLGKVKYFILLIGILFGVLLFFYAKSKPAVFTSYASLYPLTNTESSGAGGLLNTITGGGNNSNNLTQDASISLDELANSRSTLESVVAEKLPAFNNKTIAQLLIENANEHVSLFGKEIKIPEETHLLNAVGAQILQGGLVAKTNKNSLFQIYLSSTSDKLLSPITYVLVNKITGFYTDLKIQKAKSDYDFIVRKIDSLHGVLNVYDRRAIALNNTTMFTPPSKIEYTIPKENLINDKTRVVGIYNGASNNKEEAMWRLQRATPILAFLDKPDPPFIPEVPSAKLYAIIGFFIGCILGVLLFVTDILYKFSKHTVNQMIFVDVVKENVVTTTATTMSLDPDDQQTSTTL